MKVRHYLQLETARRMAAGWRKFYRIIDILKVLDPEDSGGVSP